MGWGLQGGLGAWGMGENSEPELSTPPGPLTSRPGKTQSDAERTH